MKKIRAVVPYLAAAVICVLVAMPAFSQSVTLDEAYSVNLVRGDIGKIIRGAASDVHPPLYYLILKCSSFLGGESLTKYRFVTLAATWLNLLLLGATLIRRRWGERVSLFYIMWFGVTYATLDLSVYIRMYSWGAFFVTAAALCLFFYYEDGRRRHYVCGVLMTLAAMYTHYYAVMAVFFLWLILLAALIRKRQRLKQVLLGGVLITVGYLPWLGALLRQSAKVANDYWITEFDWRECVLAPAHLWDSSFTGMGITLYLPVFALFLRACMKRKKEALASFAVFGGTMLTGGLLSVLVAPIWQDRYLYVAWGLLSLFVAVTAGEEEAGTHMLIPQVLLLGILCVAGKFSADTMRLDELMTCSDREWVDFLEEEVAEDAVVIVDDPYEHRLVYRFYLPDADIVMVRNLLNDQGAERLDDILRESEGKQLWYLVDYNQQQCGVERMRRMLADHDRELIRTAAYTIKQKSLEIFAVGGRQ